MAKKVLWILILMFIVLSTISFATVNDSNVYYFDMEKDSGLGNYTGSYTMPYDSGTSSVTGKLSNARQFTRTESDTISMGFNDPFYTYSSATVCAWVYQDSLSDMQTFASNLSGGSSSIRLNNGGSGKILSRVLAGSEPNTNLGAIIDTWYHMCLVKNSTTAHYLYVNGAFVHSGTVGAINGGNFMLGSSFGSGYFDGRLDEVGVWTEALTLEEIQTLYNSGNGYNPFPETPTNFSITAYDDITEAQIFNFSAIINGTTYNSNVSTGIIVTDINVSQLIDINVSSDGYTTSQYTDIDTTNDFVALLNQTLVNVVIRGFSHVSNATVLNFDINNTFYNATTTNGTIYTQIPVGSNLFNVTNYNGYYNKTNYELDSTLTLNFEIYFEQSRINVSLWNLIDNVAIQNFTARLTSLDYSYSRNITTTSYNALFENLSVGDYSIEVDSADFELKTFNRTIVSGVNNYNFSLYTTNSVNVSIFDQDTLNLISDRTVNVEFISDIASYNFTTSNGYIYEDFFAPADYIVRAIATGYEQGLTTLTLNNRSANNLSIYMANSTEAVDINVQITSSDGVNVEGAVVKVLRYNVATNSYNTVHISETNSDGYIVFSGYLSTEYYKLIIEYPSGTVKKITSPTYLYSQTVEIEISLAPDLLEGYAVLSDVVGRVKWNNNLFSYFYTDPSESVSQGCLKVYGIAGRVETLVATNCSSGDSNTITYIPDNTTYNTYRADGYVTIAGQEYFLSSNTKLFNEESFSGNEGLIYVLLLTIVLVFIFIGFSPEIAVSLIPTPLLIFSFLGFVAIPYGYIIPFQLIFIFGGFLIGKKR